MIFQWLHTRSGVGRASLGRISQAEYEQDPLASKVNKITQLRKIPYNIKVDTVVYLAVPDLHWLGVSPNSAAAGVAGKFN